MSAKWLNSLAARSEGQDSGLPQPRYGIVSEVDAANHAARVTIQPEGDVVIWANFDALAIGGGVTISAPPTVGDQVKISPIAGDHEDWVIDSRQPSEGAMPANSPATGKPAQSGEFIVSLPGGLTIHGSGGKWFIYGDIEHHGNTIQFGNLTVNGSINAAAASGGGGGDISDKHGSLDRLRGNHNSHGHTSVQNGSGTSGPPNAIDPE